MERQTNILPVALTIAGSDSGGGAGIQADLKTFATIGVHGTSVITCITAQNPSRVLAVSPVTPAMIRAQLASVFEELPPQAIKTGMLYSAPIIKEVVDFLKPLRRWPPLVMDPVLIATSGARLLKAEALKTLKKDLLPLARIITPNLPETEALTGIAIKAPEQMRAAARVLHGEYGCAVLIKGGHLPDWTEAIDIFFDGQTELMLSAPLLHGVKLHGTGCTYAAAIAAWCARGDALPTAVQRAKNFITRAVHESFYVGRHRVLAT